MAKQPLRASSDAARQRAVNVVGMSPASPLPIVRYAFYAFIFTIPIETLDIGIERGLFSVSHIMGYLFIGAALLQPEVSFKKLPSAFGYFVAYVFVFTCLAIVQQPNHYTFIIWVTRLATYCQMLVLFWVSFNLFQDQRLIKGAFLALGGSCVLLSILLISGGAAMAIGQGRVTALSQDANTLGSVLSLGLLALLGLAYGRTSQEWKNRLARMDGLWKSWQPGIVLTGSRGAFLSLIAGIMVLMARRGRSDCTNQDRASSLFLAIGVLVWASYENDAVRLRWERALLKGNLRRTREDPSGSLVDVHRETIDRMGSGFQLCGTGSQVRRTVESTRTICISGS